MPRAKILRLPIKFPGAEPRMNIRLSELDRARLLEYEPKRVEDLVTVKQIVMRRPRRQS